MFVQVFETANYLALHLPYDLENFTEDVFMHDIYCTKFSEREANTRNIAQHPKAG